jgi:hypothetical protein
MRLQTWPSWPVASQSEADRSRLPIREFADLPHLDPRFFTVPGPLPAPVTDDPQFATTVANVPSSGLARVGAMVGQTLHA